jgi:hypothetical protein
MREWILAFVPATLVVYFVIYPEQFSALVAWGVRFVQ